MKHKVKITKQAGTYIGRTIKLKGFIIGNNYKIIKEPQINIMSNRLEGMWIQSLKFPNIKNWMTLEFIKRVVNKYATKEQKDKFNIFLENYPKQYPR